MPVLVSLMWGANHTVPETGQGFLGIATSQLAALWSLDKKKQLAAGYRTTEMTGTEGIIRKCSRTRLVWSSGERGKPLPKKDWEEGGGRHFTSLVKIRHPSYEHQLLIVVHCYWAEQKQKKSHF